MNAPSNMTTIVLKSQVLLVSCYSPSCMKNSDACFFIFIKLLLLLRLPFKYKKLFERVSYQASLGLLQQWNQLYESQTSTMHMYEHYSLMSVGREEHVKKKKCFLGLEVILAEKTELDLMMMMMWKTLAAKFGTWLSFSIHHECCWSLAISLLLFELL